MIQHLLGKVDVILRLSQPGKQLQSPAPAAAAKGDSFMAGFKTTLQPVISRVGLHRCPTSLLSDLRACLKGICPWSCSCAYCDTKTGLNLVLKHNVELVESI